LHCGTQETCPPDVAAQYKQLVKDFNGGERERPTSQRRAEVRPHGYAVRTI
jgi:hypothetical protein